MELESRLLVIVMAGAVFTLWRGPPAVRHYIALAVAVFGLAVLIILCVSWLGR